MEIYKKILVIVVSLLLSTSLYCQKKVIKVNNTKYKYREVTKGNYNVYDKNNRSIAKVKYNRVNKSYRVIPNKKRDVQQKPNK